MRMIKGIFCLPRNSMVRHLHALMCSVTVVFIHTMEDDQRLNTLVHEGDTLYFTKACFIHYCLLSVYTGHVSNSALMPIPDPLRREAIKNLVFDLSSKSLISSDSSKVTVTIRAEGYCFIAEEHVMTLPAEFKAEGLTNS